MDSYNEDDITEALRQKLRGESLDLSPESYNRLLGMDLTKVDVPTYPADLVGGLIRGAEAYTTAPARSAQASIYLLMIVYLLCLQINHPHMVLCTMHL
jgi:hypothetical protein